jgi:hypothetical protein
MPHVTIKKLSLLDFLKKYEPVITHFLLAMAFLVFLCNVSIYLIDLAFPDILPKSITPASIFSTITPAISVVLLYELFVLTLSAGGSFINFIHREFEIISLIVLRDVFKKLDGLSTGVSSELLAELAIVAFGSLILYFFVEILERIASNVKVTTKLNPTRSSRWLGSIKTVLISILLFYFLFMTGYEIIGMISGYAGFGFDKIFLEYIFKGLVLFNIAMLFVVLIVEHTYEILFEHSALILASSVVLISLSEKPIIAVPMVITALLFVIATLLLHGFARGESAGLILQKVKDKR